ncbi:MAG TPA: hypothetical protein VF640_01415, partial [Acidimicrobiales bacterium]
MSTSGGNRTKGRGRRWWATVVAACLVPVTAASAPAAADEALPVAITAIQRVSLDEGGGQFRGTLLTAAGASISTDGRWVAFAATKSDVRQVYVRDVVAGRTALVSVSTDGEAGDASSWAPAISADGRFVAFESRAGNFGDVALDRTHVWVHDRDADADGLYDEVGGVTTVLVSRSASPGATSGEEGNGNSGFVAGPVISDDGRYVVYTSTASNLVRRDTN